MLCEAALATSDDVDREELGDLFVLVLASRSRMVFLRGPFGRLLPKPAP
jgi:hypothetical protein